MKEQKKEQELERENKLLSGIPEILPFFSLLKVEKVVEEYTPLKGGSKESSHTDAFDEDEDMNLYCRKYYIKIGDEELCLIRWYNKPSLLGRYTLTLEMKSLSPPLFNCSTSENYLEKFDAYIKSLDELLKKKLYVTPKKRRLSLTNYHWNSASGVAKFKAMRGYQHWYSLTHKLPVEITVILAKVKVKTTDGEIIREEEISLKFRLIPEFACVFFTPSYFCVVPQVPLLLTALDGLESTRVVISEKDALNPVPIFKNDKENFLKLLNRLGHWLVNRATPPGPFKKLFNLGRLDNLFADINTYAVFRSLKIPFKDDNPDLILKLNHKLLFLISKSAKQELYDDPVIDLTRFNPQEVTLEEKEDKSDSYFSFSYKEKTSLGGYPLPQGVLVKFFKEIGELVYHYESQEANLHFTEVNLISSRIVFTPISEYELKGPRFWCEELIFEVYFLVQKLQNLTLRSFDTETGLETTSTAQMDSIYKHLFTNMALGPVLKSPEVLVELGKLAISNCDPVFLKGILDEDRVICNYKFRSSSSENRELDFNCDLNDNLTFEIHNDILTSHFKVMFLMLSDRTKAF